MELPNEVPVNLQSQRLKNSKSIGQIARVINMLRRRIVSTFHVSSCSVGCQNLKPASTLLRACKFHLIAGYHHQTLTRLLRNGSSSGGVRHEWQGREDTDLQTMLRSVIGLSMIFVCTPLSRNIIPIGPPICKWQGGFEEMGELWVVQGVHTEDLIAILMSYWVLAVVSALVVNTYSLFIKVL